MAVTVLDTDIATLFLQGNEQVCRRVGAIAPEALATTVVTVEEILSGWYDRVRRANAAEKRVRAYAALRDAAMFLGRLQILPLTIEADRRAIELRKQYRRTGGNDLRIAAIVIEHFGRLATGNRRDFAPIEGLTLEDWSIISEP